MKTISVNLETGEITENFLQGKELEEWERVAAIEKNKKQVPKSVSMRQARLALLSFNLLNDVNTLIDSLGGAASIYWEFATEVHRDNELITVFKNNQSLTDDQIDDMFIKAATL